MPRPERSDEFTVALLALRRQQEQSLAAIDALLLKSEAREPGGLNGSTNQIELRVKSMTPEEDDQSARSSFASDRALKKKKTGFLSERGSMMRVLDEEKRERHQHGMRNFCLWLVLKPQFDWAMGFIIFLNSIAIGIETQQSIDDETLPGWPGEAIDFIFISIYFVEIIIRLGAFGRQNFADGWFLFDLLLVGMGLIGNIVDPLMRAAARDEGDSAFTKILVVRSLRLLRLVRAIRMLHMFRTVWRLVYGLLTSGNAIVSTFFILALTLYIFACLGVELITKDPLLESHPLTQNVVRQNFGSLQRTLLTLVSFIQADSINLVYEPICIVRPAMMIYFASIILTVTVSLMNLVTAVLVEGALANAANDKELSRHDLRQKVKKFAPKIMEVFTAIDTDGNGTIDRDELSQIQLNQLPFEIGTEQVSSLEDLFDMLDVDGQGSLTQVEFADGLLQLLTMDMPIHTMKTFKLLHLHGSMLDEIRTKLNNLK